MPPGNRKRKRIVKVRIRQVAPHRYRADETKSVGVRLHVLVIAALDAQAKTAGISRAHYIEQTLVGRASTEGWMPEL
jgi:hypothetical protein